MAIMINLGDDDLGGTGDVASESWSGPEGTPALTAEAFLYLAPYDTAMGHETACAPVRGYHCDAGLIPHGGTEDWVPRGDEPSLGATLLTPITHDSFAHLPDDEDDQEARDWADASLRSLREWAGENPE